MKKVKELRKKYGFTQLQIADKLCLQRSNYSAIESGKYKAPGKYEDFESKIIDAIEAVRIDEINKLKNL